MSATPIPQTLAKTLYGDLDIVTIKSVPRGRKPVQTFVVPDAKRSDMEAYIEKKITGENAQVYYVVPRIETVDEFEKIKDLRETFASLERGLLAAIPKTMVHGKMKSHEKQTQFRRFADGEVRLLASTSLIEVGIDVSQATVIVIENAERFGLSQLHQLRGRVGRGSIAGYCFLMTGDSLNEDGRKRLEKFCKTHDGFEIADLDLELRGPGDVIGYRQSGWDELQMADIVKDADLFREIQEELDTFLAR
jgi:ATP-dependent DNA helicase RecG